MILIGLSLIVFAVMFAVVIERQVHLHCTDTQRDNYLCMKSCVDRNFVQEPRPTTLFGYCKVSFSVPCPECHDFSNASRTPYIE